MFHDELAYVLQHIHFPYLKYKTVIRFRGGSRIYNYSNTQESIPVQSFQKSNMCYYVDAKRHFRIVLISFFLLSYLLNKTFQSCIAPKYKSDFIIN